MRYARAALICALLVLGPASLALADPTFSLETEADWNTYLSASLPNPTVSAVTEIEFNNLPPETLDDIGTGTYRVPELYTYDGTIYENVGQTYDMEGAGLVMAWGPADPEHDSGDYIAGWKFDYGTDPNITSAVINVTLFAPQFGPWGQINTMTFGLQSPNAGNPLAPFTRSWTWNIGPNPGVQLPWNTNNPITILVAPKGQGVIGDATAIDGGAMIPVAAAAYADNGFDPTQAQWFVAFENGNWIGNAVVNPPGSGQVQAWNYWRNLQVTPVPEPASLSVVGLGLLGLAARRRRS